MDATSSWLPIIASVLISFAASSGFWAYVQKRTESKGAHTRLLMGLAYDKIVTLGMRYIERGWITNDEYEDLRKYFYEPYKEFGGNGTAERIMNEVSQLSFRARNLHTEMVRAKLSWKDDDDDAERRDPRA